MRSFKLPNGIALGLHQRLNIVFPAIVFPAGLVADRQNSNRATEAEISLPTVKKYKRRQDLMAHSRRPCLSA